MSSNKNILFWGLMLCLLCVNLFNVPTVNSNNVKRVSASTSLFLFDSAVAITLPNTFVIPFEFTHSVDSFWMCTSSDGSASIALKRSGLMTKDSLPKIFYSYVGKFTDQNVDWLSSKMTDGFIRLEFKERDKQHGRYCNMLVTELDGKLFVAAFTCPRKQFNKWAKSGTAIINSVKFIQR